MAAQADQLRRKAPMYRAIRTIEYGSGWSLRQGMARRQGMAAARSDAKRMAGSASYLIQCDKHSTRWAVPSRDGRVITITIEED